MSGQLLVWAAWILSILWFGGCAAILVWSLWGDAGKKLRRCPRCWHDLSHTEGLTCSECGQIAKNEKALHRRKPRRIAGYGSLGAALLGALVISQVVGTAGLLGMAPTRALIWVLPLIYDPDGGGPVGRELTKRLRATAVGIDDTIALAEVCVAADQRTPPHSPEWEAGYGLLLEWVISSADGWSLRPNARSSLTASLARLDAVLEAAGVNFTLDAPVSWNAGEPLIVRLWMRDWHRTPSQVRLTMECPQAVGGCTDWALASQQHSGQVPLSWNVGVLPDGPQEITVRLRWQRRDDRGDWVDSPAIEEHLTISFEEARRLNGVTDAQLATAMQFVLLNGLLLSDEGSARAGFRLDLNWTQKSEFDGMVFGVLIQALENGVPRRTLRAWWRGGVYQLDGHRSWELAEEDLVALQRARFDQSDWTLRVQGLPELAARAAHLDPHRDRGASSLNSGATPWREDSSVFHSYWSGSFEVPLRVTPLGAGTPDRPWTRIPAPTVR